MNESVISPPKPKPGNWKPSREDWFAKIKSEYVNQTHDAVTAIKRMHGYLDLRDEIVVSDKCWKTPNQWADTSVRVFREELPKL